jgi:hypothetical protein
VEVNIWQDCSLDFGRGQGYSPQEHACDRPIDRLYRLHIGMTEPLKRIRVIVGGIQLEADLKFTKTAGEVYAALPVEAPVNTWGEEFYFKISGVKDYRETATTQVKAGDVAYWGAGQVLAIFFGRTPMSLGPDPVPADRVNVIGRIVGDPSQLRRAMGASSIRVERV